MIVSEMMNGGCLVLTASFADPSAPFENFLSDEHPPIAHEVVVVFCAPLDLALFVQVLAVKPALSPLSAVVVDPKAMGLNVDVRCLRPRHGVRQRVWKQAPTVAALMTELAHNQRLSIVSDRTPDNGFFLVIAGSFGHSRGST
jgi:hypothetical protein